MSRQRHIRRNMERTELTAKNKAKKKAIKHRFDSKKKAADYVAGKKEEK